jgi:hypothetical protein
MLNQLVVLVNILGLFLIDIFFIADISITQSIPPTMAPGSEVRVTVTVNKGDLTGFAKLQLDLPPGLSATAIETKGASFTFADGKAKFIWMALPTTPTFKISYTLSASSIAQGLLPVTGRLSYIENNERKTYELPVMKVDLGAPGAAVAARIEEDEDATPGDLVSAAGGAPAKKGAAGEITDHAGPATAQGAGGVTVQREITPLSETEIQVSVTIRKGDLRGFGKLQENIPQGSTAIEQDSEGAIFTAQDQVVKFVWLNMPVRGDLKVVYRVRSNALPHGEYSIDGDFGYLLNDETQRVPIGRSKFITGPKALEALAHDEQRTDVQEQTDPQLEIRSRQDTAKAQPPTKQKEQPATKKEKEAPVARTPITGPERGITYKVQITAAHREVGRPYFIARHRYDGDFSIERHQGWIKYVTGRFSEYAQARDQRQAFIRAGHNFPGPFVTAYNNGERITVQEALMISQQKWVQ